VKDQKGPARVLSDGVVVLRIGKPKASRFEARLRKRTLKPHWRRNEKLFSSPAIGLKDQHFFEY
jgi:hypothetical protein